MSVKGLVNTLQSITCGNKRMNDRQENQTLKDQAIIVKSIGLLKMVTYGAKMINIYCSVQI